jgi:hypothetical protein
MGAGLDSPLRGLTVRSIRPTRSGAGEEASERGWGEEEGCCWGRCGSGLSIRVSCSSCSSCSLVPSLTVLRRDLEQTVEMSASSPRCTIPRGQLLRLYPECSPDDACPECAAIDRHVAIRAHRADERRRTAAASAAPSSDEGQHSHAEGANASSTSHSPTDPGEEGTSRDQVDAPSPEPGAAAEHAALQPAVVCTHPEWRRVWTFGTWLLFWSGCCCCALWNRPYQCTTCGCRQAKAPR